MLRIPVLALAIFLAAASPLGYAADQSVTFNVQVNLKKLHPQVEKVRLHCAVKRADGNSAQGQTFTPGTDAKPGADGSYVGTLTGTVVVPSEETQKVTGWVCSLFATDGKSGWHALLTNSQVAWTTVVGGPHSVSGQFQ